METFVYVCMYYSHVLINIFIKLIAIYNIHLKYNQKCYDWLNILILYICLLLYVYKRVTCPLISESFHGLINLSVRSRLIRTELFATTIIDYKCYREQLKLKYNKEHGYCLFFLYK